LESWAFAYGTKSRIQLSAQYLGGGTQSNEFVKIARQTTGGEDGLAYALNSQGTVLDSLLYANSLDPLAAELQRGGPLSTNALSGSATFNDGVVVIWEPYSGDDQEFGECYPNE